MKKTELIVLAAAAGLAWYMLRGTGSAQAVTIKPNGGTSYANPLSTWFNFAPAGVKTSPYSLYDGINDSYGLDMPAAVWSTDGKLTLDGEGGLGFTNSGGLGLTYGGVYANGGGEGRPSYSLW